MQVERFDHCDILWQTKKIVGRIGELRSDSDMQVRTVYVQYQQQNYKET